MKRPALHAPLLAALPLLFPAAAWAATMDRAGDLWFVHGLAAVVTGVLTFALSRSWAGAGLFVIAAAAYAARYASGFPFAAEAVPKYGEAYLAQAQASALLVPVAALIGAVAAVARARRAG